MVWWSLIRSKVFGRKKVNKKIIESKYDGKRFILEGQVVLLGSVEIGTCLLYWVYSKLDFLRYSCTDTGCTSVIVHCEG